MILKPSGRGNWATVTMQIDGRHVTPLSVRVPCYVETIERDRGDGIWRCPINLIAELAQG